MGTREIGVFATSLAVIATLGCSSAVTPGDASADASAIDAGSSLDATITDATVTDAAIDTADSTTASPTVTITALTVYGDCMPIVAPDPIHASWRTTVDGATGTSATLLSALLVIRPSTTGATITQNLTVDVTTIALSGGHGSAMQTKTGADANPPPDCTGVCGGEAHLMLAFMIDGAPVYAAAQVTTSCAF